MSLVLYTASGTPRAHRYVQLVIDTAQARKTELALVYRTETRRHHRRSRGPTTGIPAPCERLPKGNMYIRKNNRNWCETEKADAGREVAAAEGISALTISFAKVSPDNPPFLFFADRCHLNAAPALQPRLA